MQYPSNRTVPSAVPSTGFDRQAANVSSALASAPGPQAVTYTLAPFARSVAARQRQEHVLPWSLQAAKAESGVKRSSWIVDWIDNHAAPAFRPSEKIEGGVGRPAGGVAAFCSLGERSKGAAVGRGVGAGCQVS